MQAAGRIYSEITTRTEVKNLDFVKSLSQFDLIRNAQFQPFFKQTIGIMVTRIANLQGIKGEIDDLNKADLLGYIKNYCLDLSFEEITKAFELERSNEYPAKSNHFNLFNRDYFSEIIKKYRTWKQKFKQENDHLLKSEKTNLLEQTTKSNEKELMDKAIERCFLEFAKEKTISDPFIHIFQELVSRGFILRPETEELKNYYNSKKELAKKLIQSEIKKSKSSLNLSLRKEAKKQLLEFETKENNIVLLRAKKLVLEDLFQKVISEGKDHNYFIIDG